MLTTLDFACPIAWKSAGQPSGSSVTTIDFSSPISVSKRASLFSNARQGQEDKAGHFDDDDWLHRRYLETLWLGEDHSPLIGFLQHLRRFERKARQYAERQSQVMPSFAKLLRSRQNIRRRFAAASSGLSDGDAMQQMIEGLRKADDEEEERNMVEKEIMKMALDSGPGSLINAELRRLEDKAGDAKITKSWLRAIESRELQMQILLVLTLLRLSTQAPLVSASTSASNVRTRTESIETVAEQRAPLETTQPDINGDSAAATPTLKRKRKADHAKRWIGGTGISAFPWTLQRQSSRDDLNKRSEDDENSTSPESLSKRFESLLDSLCLQVLTSNLSLDDIPEKKNRSPSTLEEGSRNEASHPRQLFGSDGRRRQQSRGDKDILQWLCCHIIEPHFSKSLPRQCGIVRGKCFVPGSGSTPARPSRKEVDAKSLQSTHTISTLRDQERRAEEKEDRRRQRSVSRVQSQSPAPLQNLSEETRTQQPLRSTSTLVGKWDARTVSVRRKWDRSQSIGPTTKSEAPVFERSSSVQPRGRTDDRTSRREKKDPHTLVMETPQKGQASTLALRSSSFSSQSQLHPRSNSAASASLAAWRKTESQPVLTTGLKGQLSEAQHSNDEDADKSISTFFEDSGDEDDFGFPPSKIHADTETASMNAVISLHTGRPNLAARSESQPVYSGAIYCSDEEDDSSEELKPITILKKRRTMPGSLSFAGVEQQCIAAARNPFAVSK